MSLGMTLTRASFSLNLFVLAMVALPSYTTYCGPLSLCWTVQIARQSAHSETAGEWTRVQLDGTVAYHAETTTVPLSGEQCVAFSIEAVKNFTNGPRIVATASDGVPSVLATDDADILAADIGDFETRFEDDSEGISATIADLPDDVRQCFEAAGADPTGLFGSESATRIVRENRLHVGEQASVDGVAGSSVDGRLRRTLQGSSRRDRTDGTTVCSRRVPVCCPTRLSRG